MIGKNEDRKKYEIAQVESAWQQYWRDHGMYQAVDDDARPKQYVLVEFPYPSGEGLHVGHCLSYIAQDVVARWKRMQGNNVLYPIGWDAFGLPTENFAIKHKIKPQDATARNVANFKRQIQSLGISFDWSREVNTTDPSYYRWTQWIFLQLFKKGLAEKREMPINWCPSCKIGLAFEEVIDGKCERCGHAVEQRTIAQWVLKITEYADRLVADLDTVDFSPEIKQQQINWIGRSEGAQLFFEIPSKNNYVLLHGFTGSPSANFFPWLKKNLESRGARVAVPALPETDNPNIPQQIDYVLKNCVFSEDTVLLGHSLGSAVALKVVEQLEKPIRKLVLAAGFAQPKFLDHDRPFADSFDWQFDWSRIKKNCGEIILLRDVHDDAVGPERIDELHQFTGGRIVDFEAEDIHICGETEPVVLQHVLDGVHVFTTRPDTIFGATYLVLAPEHALVKKLEGDVENKKEVTDYVAGANRKTERERQEQKEKTGVELKGVTAINPATQQAIPIWVADYVLSGYGTGAIMAVPAHDERDFEFAKKYELPIVQVVAPHFVDPANPPKAGQKKVVRNIVHAIVRRPADNAFLMLQWKGEVWGDRPPKTFILGGVDEGEDVAEAARREIHEETGYKNLKFIKDLGVVLHTEYSASHKKENRYAKIRVVEFELVDDAKDDVAPAEQEKHDPVWVAQKDVRSFFNVADGSFECDWYEQGGFAITGPGIVINSGKYDDLTTEEARKKMAKDFGAPTVQYKLRDWIFSRQHYWGEPIPIIHCPKCGTVPVPENELPVTLPDVDHYEPTDTGESPLAKITDWVNVTCPQCGGPAQRETDTMPNWAGSSWYFLRYIDPTNARRLADPKKLKYWLPVDLYNGGAEHTTLHLLYSRFWHKFLYDIGAVPTSEPYQRRVHHGIILAPDGQKMSKSRGNVINPDDIVSHYGADVFRLYMLFMGEYDQVKRWSDANIAGVARFLKRAWQFVSSTAPDAENQASEIQDGTEASILHRGVKTITAHLERRSFNTAVSNLMILLNELEDHGTVSRSTREIVVLLLAPFAPHLAEECWQNVLKHKDSVHTQQWPIHNERMIAAEGVLVGIQINGKIRAELLIADTMSDDEVRSQALALPAVAKHIDGKPIKKFIYVKNKIVSVVV